MNTIEYSKVSTDPKVATKPTYPLLENVQGCTSEEPRPRAFYP